MSEEEKEAIETMQHWIEYEKENKEKINKADELIQMQETILNLIQKQEKIIDKIAKMINTHDIDEDICGQFGKNKDCSDYNNEELCIDCIKKYFERQVEENGN